MPCAAFAGGALCAWRGISGRGARYRSRRLSHDHFRGFPVVSRPPWNRVPAFRLGGRGPFGTGIALPQSHQATSVSRCTGRDVHSCVGAQIGIVRFADALASVCALSLKLQRGAARQIRVRCRRGFQFFASARWCCCYRRRLALLRSCRTSRVIRRRREKSSLKSRKTARIPSFINGWRPSSFPQRKKAQHE